MASNRQFGDALRLIRIAKKLTQEDFSTISSRTYISTLERGLKSPTLDKIDSLAKTLDIHPLTLIAVAYARGDGAQLKDLCGRVEAEFSDLANGRPDLTPGVDRS